MSAEARGSVAGPQTGALPVPWIIFYFSANGGPPGVLTPVRLAVPFDRAGLDRLEAWWARRRGGPRETLWLDESGYVVVPDVFPDTVAVVLRDELPAERYPDFDGGLEMSDDGQLRGRLRIRHDGRYWSDVSLWLRAGTRSLLRLYWTENAEAAMDALVAVADAEPRAAVRVLQFGGVRSPGRLDVHRLPPFTPEQYARLLDHRAREVREAAALHARSALSVPPGRGGRPGR
jgi:hypothetical protein